MPGSEIAQTLGLDPKVKWLGAVPVNIHLGVIRRMGEPVFVDHIVFADKKPPVFLFFAGEITADAADTPRIKISAGKVIKAALHRAHESE